MKKFKHFSRKESRLIVDSIKKYFDADPNRSDHFDLNLRTREKLNSASDPEKVYMSAAAFGENVEDIKKDEVYISASFIPNVQAPGTYGKVLKFKYIKELCDYALSNKFFNEKVCYINPFSYFLDYLHINNWNHVAYELSAKKIKYILDRVLEVEPFIRKTNTLGFYGVASSFFRSIRWFANDKKKMKVYEDYFNKLPLPKILRVALFTSDDMFFNAKEGFDNSIQTVFHERWILDRTFERTFKSMYSDDECYSYMHINLKNYFKAYPNDFDLEECDPSKVSELLNSYSCFVDDSEITISMGILGIKLPNTPSMKANYWAGFVRDDEEDASNE